MTPLQIEESRLLYSPSHPSPIPNENKKSWPHHQHEKKLNVIIIIINYYYNIYNFFFYFIIFDVLFPDVIFLVTEIIFNARSHFHNDIN